MTGSGDLFLPMFLIFIVIYFILLFYFVYFEYCERVCFMNETKDSLNQIAKATIKIAEKT